MLKELGAPLAKTRPIGLFQHLPKLAGLCDDIWRDALDTAQVLCYPAGTDLNEFFNQADRFVIVLQGVVKVYEADDTGREITLYRVYGGQILVLTLIHMLHRTRRCALAMAEEDVRLLSLPPEYFDHMLEKSEGFRRYFMTSMANCITDVTQLITHVSFNHLNFRLAHLIRRFADQSTPCTVRLTHQALANELGTTREVVSRLLKGFERSGSIKLNRGSIEIVDMGELETILQ